MTAFTMLIGKLVNNYDVYDKHALVLTVHWMFIIDK